MKKITDEEIISLKKEADSANQESMLKLANILYPRKGSFSDLLEKSYQEGYNDAKTEKYHKYSNTPVWGYVKIGDIIKFGNYYQNTIDKKEPIEWLVLTIEKEKALIISKYALDIKKYHEVDEDTTWDKCTLRKWLNDEFLNSAFTKDEQEQIQVSRVASHAIPIYAYRMKYQGKDINDKIFLLSAKELMKYCDCEENRQCLFTKHLIDKLSRNDGIWKCDNGSWTLRTLGCSYDAHCTMYVDNMGQMGSIIGDWYPLGVRPALWVNLKIYSKL